MKIYYPSVPKHKIFTQWNVKTGIKTSTTLGWNIKAKKVQ